jgi:hypothetical protein
MTIRLTFVCDGCHKEAPGTGFIEKHFVSVSGRSYGFGSYRYVKSPADLAPEGWMPFDPYTQCCYCPECWASIEGEEGS